MNRSRQTTRLALMTSAIVLLGSLWPVVAIAADPSNVTAGASHAAEATSTESSTPARKPPRGVVVDGPSLDRAEAMPAVAQEVGVSERRGDMLPRGLRFIDDQGKEVQLGDYLEAGKPMILYLGYYNCPMLCDLVMNGVNEAVREMKWFPGEDYQIVSVSIDPTEDHKLAASKKQTYIDDLGYESAKDGWHFLTGDQNNIDALSQATGYSFAWDARQMEFAHPAVILLITPEGKISRYLYGVKFPARTLRLSLVEASEGKIGSPLDQIILTCFHFDPSMGSYTLSAMRLMRLGGTLTVTVVIAVIGLALAREMYYRRHPQARKASKASIVT